MAAVGRESFDRGDFFPGDGRNGCDARARGFSVDVHRAGAAQGHAAAEFRPGHPHRVAQDPQQRHIGIDVHRLCFSIQNELNRHWRSPRSRCRLPQSTRVLLKVHLLRVRVVGQFPISLLGNWAEAHPAKSQLLRRGQLPTNLNIWILRPWTDSPTTMFPFESTIIMCGSENSPAWWPGRPKLDRVCPLSWSMILIASCPYSTTYMNF